MNVPDFRRPASRRHALRQIARLSLAIPTAAALAACGFQLRRAPELRFSTIQLAGFAPGSNLAALLRIQIASTTTTRVVEAATQAQVVLRALSDASERVVVASTAAGQVREIQLRSRFIFTLRTVDDIELIPRTELLLRRDLSYSEEAVLGKEQEEALLFRAMQSDIADQITRRLAAVRLPQP
ncbi:hypothetical protein BH09PSE5_BH09PSE5_09890 [soil metagenome]